MRKHISAILIFVGTTTVATTVALLHTSATFHDKVYVLANGAIASALFVFALTAGIIAHAKKRPIIRSYAIATVLASALVAVTPIVGTSHRLNATKQYLSRTYAQLAENGPPFPQHPPVPQDQNSHHLISHGYWVAEDQQSFEVYYHDSSDSFTMAYPVGRWEWRGNEYTGPQPKQ